MSFLCVFSSWINNEFEKVLSTPFIPTISKLSHSLNFSLDAKIANLESAHSEQLSEWNKRGERLERRLQEVERQWQQISHLENADKDEIATQRPQFEVGKYNKNIKVNISYLQYQTSS